MPHDGNLQLLIVAEVLMIVHLPCQESIGFLVERLFEHEIARPSAKYDFAHRTLQQLIVHQAFNMEYGLDALEKLQGILRLGQHADNSATRHDGVFMPTVLHLHGMRQKQSHLLQFQLLGDFEVHAILGIIQIRMRRIDRHVVLDSLPYTPLHVVAVGHGLQPVEQQRMV